MTTESVKWVPNNGQIIKFVPVGWPQSEVPSVGGGVSLSVGTELNVVWEMSGRRAKGNALFNLLSSPYYPLSYLALKGSSVCGNSCAY